MPALEIMIVNPAIRNLIREKKVYQIDLVIETSLQEGMITLNRSLAELVKNRGKNGFTFKINPHDSVTIDPAGLYELISKYE